MYHLYDRGTLNAYGHEVARGGGGGGSPCTGGYRPTKEARAYPITSEMVQLKSSNGLEYASVA